MAATRLAFFDLGAPEWMRELRRLGGYEKFRELERLRIEGRPHSERHKINSVCADDVRRFFARCSTRRATVMVMTRAKALDLMFAIAPFPAMIVHRNKDSEELRARRRSFRRRHPDGSVVIVIHTINKKKI